MASIRSHGVHAVPEPAHYRESRVDDRDREREQRHEESEDGELLVPLESEQRERVADEIRTCVPEEDACGREVVRKETQERTADDQADGEARG